MPHDTCARYGRVWTMSGPARGLPSYTRSFSTRRTPKSTVLYVESGGELSVYGELYPESARIRSQAFRVTLKLISTSRA